MERVERELTFLLRQAQKVHLHDAAGPRLLDRSAYTMLGHLHDQGPSRPTDLADAFRLDLSTVSRQVATLQAAGLVRRHQDPADRRAFLLATTPAGADALRRTRAHRRQRLREVLASWPETDVDLLADLLERFNADLRQRHAEDDRSRVTASAPPATRAGTSHTTTTTDPGDERP